MIRFAIALLTLIVVLLLAGAVPVAGMDAAAVFRSPAFILLLGMAGVGLVVAAAKRRRPWRWLGIYVCHTAIALILAGGFFGHRWGVKRLLRLVDGQSPVTELRPACRQHQRELVGFLGAHVPFRRVIEVKMVLNRLLECDHPECDRQPVDFGFPVTIEDCAVEYYPGEEEGDRGGVKRYTATLVCDQYDSPQLLPIAVNEPVTYEGWRFYLEGFRPYLPGLPENHPGQAWVVTLVARWDPGRLCVVVGFWALIIGTALCCWTRRREPPGVAP